MTVVDSTSPNVELAASLASLARAVTAGPTPVRRWDPVDTGEDADWDVPAYTGAVPLLTDDVYMDETTEETQDTDTEDDALETEDDALEITTSTVETPVAPVEVPDYANGVISMEALQRRAAVFNSGLAVTAQDDDSEELDDFDPSQYFGLPPEQWSRARSGEDDFLSHRPTVKASIMSDARTLDADLDEVDLADDIALVDEDEDNPFRDVKTNTAPLIVIGDGEDLPAAPLDPLGDDDEPTEDGPRDARQVMSMLRELSVLRDQL